MKWLDELAGGVAYVLLLIGAFLALHLAPAHAGEGVRLEVLGGQCQAEELGNGSWHHEYYPFELNLRSRCFQVSISELTGNWRGWDTGLRLGYVDLGSMRLNAVWWLRDEDLAGRPDGMSCTLGIDGNPKNCLANGSIQQRVKGLAFGGLLERDVARHLRIGFEGGLMLYEGAFDMWVKPYPHPDTYRGWSGHFDGLQLTPYFGATLNSGPFMLSARVYTLIRAAEHGCGGCSGPTKGPATQITAGLSLPF